MKTRTWPILTAGFGSLLVLICLFSLGIDRRAQQINVEVSSMYQAAQNVEQALNEFQSDLYVSGILARDYLLDPSELTAVAQRQQLLEVRLGMSNHLGQLVKLSTFEELGILDRLQAENNIYWDTLVPIFEWTPSQKLALSSLFLRKQVLPRRTAVLSMAEEIREFNQANFNKNQERIWRRQRDFRGYLGKMVAVVLSLSLMVAVASIFRISRLERRSEEQRRETQHAEYELRRLSQELVRTQEEERKSLSRELHDEVGQKLTALRMELGNLGRLRKAGDGEFQEHLEGTRQLAGEALQVVRDLAMGLRPSMLDDLGLAPALEWQAREFYRRSGVPVTVQIDGNLDPLSDSHRTCVYRVVQEALTNCARHSMASSIRIALHGDGETLSLTIQDDGLGFNSEKPSGRGLGLIGIEERVRELGGKTTIFSQPQKGTLLQMEMPLTPEVIS